MSLRKFSPRETVAQFKLMVEVRTRNCCPLVRGQALTVWIPVVPRTWGVFCVSIKATEAGLSGSNEKVPAVQP